MHSSYGAIFEAASLESKSFGQFAGIDLNELEMADEAKWYDYREEMIELSEAFPAVLLTLHGEGEENGDVWNEYYLAGLYQYEEAVITIPVFNVDKLEEWRS